MSEKSLWLVALFTVALTGFAPAQQTTKKLTKENAALRAQVESMTAELARLKTRLDDSSKALAQARARLVAAQAAQRKKAAEQAVARKVRARAVPVKRPKNPVLRAQRVFVNGRAIKGTVIRSSRPTNPLMKGAYQKSLEQLIATRKKLDKIEDPTEAREVVDEMSRLILNVRRELWELEKNAKKQKSSGNDGDTQVEKKK